MSNPTVLSWWHWRRIGWPALLWVIIRGFPAALIAVPLSLGAGTRWEATHGPEYGVIFETKSMVSFGVFCLAFFTWGALCALVLARRPQMWISANQRRLGFWALLGTDMLAVFLGGGAALMILGPLMRDVSRLLILAAIILAAALVFGILLSMTATRPAASRIPPPPGPSAPPGPPSLR